LDKLYEVKIVLAVSIDGRISLPQGGKTNFGNVGDRRVLEEALSASDAIIMGAQTLRDHQSTCLIHDKDLIENRQISGKSPQPITIVVSNKINFSNEIIFFQQPIQRWLLCPETKTNLKDKENNFSKILYLKNSWEETFKFNCIEKYGISKVLLLGGSKLIQSFLQEDFVDKLQLTITPKIVGGSKTWVTQSIERLPIELRQKKSWELREIKPLDFNEIMLCYDRSR